MRPALALLLSTAAALVCVTVTPAATEANCTTQLTYRGARHIVTSRGVGCTQALSMAKKMITARTIGTRTVGGVRLLRLQPPLPGWTCATGTPVRLRGAGCAKGALRVIYIRIT